MLDPAFVRSNFDRVAERLATRGGNLPLDRFRELDQRRRTAITEAEQLKAHKNAETVKIGQLKRDELSRYKPALEIDIMRRIKRALDPAGLLNPGKVV